MIARRVMREKYVTADVGISGANFAIAETGMVSITENEGNARLTARAPEGALISLLGIEKILPKLRGPRALSPAPRRRRVSGQTITCYNSMYGGPRQPGESDGPRGVCTWCCSTIIARACWPTPSSATPCTASAAARA